MRKLSITALYSAGIAMAAIAAAGFPRQFDLETAPPEVVERFWSLGLPLFIAGVVISVVTSIFVRRQHHEELTGGEVNAANDPVILLDAVCDAVNGLADRADAEPGAMDTRVVHDRVERIVLDRMLPLAESRHRLAEQLGQGRFAEVFGAIAAGERYLNRAWSAATDHHLPEAVASVREARHHFEAARAMLREQGA